MLSALWRYRVLWKISLIVLGLLLGVSATIKPFTVSKAELLETVAQTDREPSLSSPASEEEAPRRLSITLSVSSPDEILVKEGDRLIQGQVVASNVPAKQRALEQQQQLKISIAQLTQDFPKPPAPPPPSFAAEDAAIDSARANLQFLEAQKEPEFFMKDEDLIQVFESRTLKEKQTIANRRMNGHFRLNEAIANRQEAESNYQRELYQHQLKLLEIDQENRRRSAEVLSQREKLAVIETTIAEADFKSPYAGQVRKVKILGQNGRLLNVEILVINPDRNG